VPQDYAEAARWYRLAAEAGHPEAQKNLGFLYAAGKGVAQDQAEAEKWFRKAGASGNAGASFAGGLLALSKTNSANPPRSPLLKGFVKADSLPAKPAVPPATKASAPQDPDGQYALGLRYANGDGVEQSFVKAAESFRLAAEAGHAAAQKNLGLLYASGKGVTQDYAKAEKWLRQAAAKGAVGAGVPKAAAASANSPAGTEASATHRQGPAPPSGAGKD
jgi:TPR repeat protein